MSAFLSADDLVLLTGYKRPADQARWLDRNRIPFTINAKGHPVVPRDMTTKRKEPEIGFVA